MPTIDLDVLTPAQLSAIDLLVMGHSLTGTARKLGIERHTLYAWRRRPAFAQALADRRREVFKDSIQQLQALSAKAVNVLAQEMRATSKTRLEAAEIVLKFIIQLANAGLPNMPESSSFHQPPMFQDAEEHRERLEQIRQRLTARREQGEPQEPHTDEVTP